MATMTAARVRGLRVRASAPALVTAGLTVLFLLVTAWWLAADERIPDFDSGKHMLFALQFNSAWAEGDLLAPFSDFTAYPPLVHIVGALGLRVGGIDPTAPVLAAAIVFVPLLTWSLYRLGALLESPPAGALAAGFALGTPIVATQFHAFMLEAPETALVALSLWCLVAGRRFADVRWSVAAGVACGLGMLAKQTFPFFLAGFVVVLLARGGWRHWRGLAAAAVAFAIVALPWYLIHRADLDESFAYADVPPDPPRWSAANAAWFTWSQLNWQLWLPLSLLLLAGIVAAVRRFVRERDPADHTPELLAGLAGAYVCLTLLMGLHAPYYALPMLPFEALLATLWLARLRGRPARLAIGAFALVGAVNFLAVSVVGPHPVRFTVGPHAPTGPLARSVTVVGDSSWLSGPPEDGGRLLDLLEAAKRDGVQRVEVDPATDLAFFNTTGVTALATFAGLPRTPSYDPAALGPRDLFITRRDVEPGAPPCALLQDGSGLYMTLGNPVKPLAAYDYCPGR